jgi:acyl-CoA reductase-like NAD-dependent aldehyde dehydrogenase
MLIAGELRDARSGQVLEAVNPATGRCFASFPRGGALDIDDAVEAGIVAFPQWWKTSPLERASCLEGLASLIVEHADELIALDVIDNGSTIRQLRHDAMTAAKQLRYFAGLVLEQRGDTVPSGHGRLNFTLRHPFGVVGRIIPFNHPLMFAAQKIGAPLIAGNTVVLKPSEYTSVSALRLGELARDVFPPGVLNIVTGLGREVGEALVNHPKVRRIAFTGSVATGLAIQASAASRVVKTVTLELGGKNPIVVFSDADLDKAIDGTIRGMSFTFQGQSCGSTSRLLVHSSIHDSFVSKLAARIDALRVGPPGDDATDVGSIVHRDQYDKVVSYLNIAREEGLELLAGGGVPTDSSLDGGLYVRPTLFGNVPATSRLLREEIFGPILVVVPFDGYDDAVLIANDVSYGLTASVYTSSLAIALKFARDVEAGYVWVNDVGAHILGAPFGGLKDSGVGREENLAEILSYSQEKNVHVLFD